MFKYEVGDICMIKNAPEAYDELNGWVVTLQKASLFFDVESWWTEERIPNIFMEINMPIPESWLFKFCKIEKESGYE